MSSTPTVADVCDELRKAHPQGLRETKALLAADLVAPDRRPGRADGRPVRPPVRLRRGARGDAGLPEPHEEVAGTPYAGRRASGPPRSAPGPRVRAGRLRRRRHRGAERQPEPREHLHPPVRRRRAARVPARRRPRPGLPGRRLCPRCWSSSRRTTPSTRCSAGMPYTFGLAKQLRLRHPLHRDHPPLAAQLPRDRRRQHLRRRRRRPARRPPDPRGRPSSARRSRRAARRAPVRRGHAAAPAPRTTGGDGTPSSTTPGPTSSTSAPRATATTSPPTGSQRTSRPGTLPNVGMVIPDLCNDAHDCDLVRRRRLVPYRHAAGLRRAGLEVGPARGRGHRRRGRARQPGQHGAHRWCCTAASRHGWSTPR